MPMRTTTILFFVLTACSTPPAINLSENQRDLKPCGDKPNCVSSTDQREEFNIPVLKCQGHTDFQNLTKIISSAAWKVQASSETYIHARYKSALFGFVDDVEVSCHSEKLWFRSESRTGYSDLGVNRKRIEKIIEKHLANSN